MRTRVYTHTTVNAASAYFDGKRPQYTQKSSFANYGSLYSLVTPRCYGDKVSLANGHLGSDYVTYDLEQLDALIIEGTKLDQSINQA